jgi:hypothetical protein
MINANHSAHVEPEPIATAVSNANPMAAPSKIFFNLNKICTDHQSRITNHESRNLMIAFPLKPAPRAADPYGGVGFQFGRCQVKCPDKAPRTPVRAVHLIAKVPPNRHGPKNEFEKTDNC